MNNSPDTGDIDSYHIRKIIEGNVSSFDALYYKYERKLYTFCLLLTHSQQDSEEIVQEVFVKVWETRNRLDPNRSFPAYIIRIARNLIYNKTSKRIREQASAKYISYLYPIECNTTQEEINLHSLENLISKLINHLPLMQKKVFIMSRINELSNKEIANQLQISNSTVENHLYLALKTLKKLMKFHIVIAYFFMFL